MRLEQRIDIRLLQFDQRLSKHKPILPQLHPHPCQQPLARLVRQFFLCPLAYSLPQVCPARKSALPPWEGCEWQKVLADPAVAPAVEIRHGHEPGAGCWIAQKLDITVVRI
jgi:hypothetical protein